MTSVLLCLHDKAKEYHKNFFGDIRRFVLLHNSSTVQTPCEDFVSEVCWRTLLSPLYFFSLLTPITLSPSLSLRVVCRILASSERLTRTNGISGTGEYRMSLQ